MASVWSWPRPRIYIDDDQVDARAMPPPIPIQRRVDIGSTPSPRKYFDKIYNPNPDGDGAEVIDESMLGQ